MGHNDYWNPKVDDGCIVNHVVMFLGATPLPSGRRLSLPGANQEVAGEPRVERQDISLLVYRQSSSDNVIALLLCDWEAAWGSGVMNLAGFRVGRWG
jgi:hypothetical protein